MKKTAVIFRKYQGNSVIVAIFPEFTTGQWWHSLVSYTLEEGFCQIGKDYIPVYTEEATPQEYQELKEKLESLGYSLRVCKRRTKKHEQVAQENSIRRFKLE